MDWCWYIASAMTSQIICSAGNLRQPNAGFAGGGQGLCDPLGIDVLGQRGEIGEGVSLASHQSQGG